MPTSRTTRRPMPTLGGLGFNSPTAKADLEELGWLNSQSVELLWALSGAGDPDLALNTLIRLRDQLTSGDYAEGQEYADFDAAIRSDVAFRVRLLSLVGASTAMGDHLVANPGLWRLVAQPMPTPAEMMRELLECVQATPLDASASATLTTPGTYRAGLTGADAEKALKCTYRTLLMRIAAHDLAGTYPESPRRPGQPLVPFDQVTGMLTALADAALTAALAVAVAVVWGEKDYEGQMAVLAMGKCGAQELN